MLLSKALYPLFSSASTQEEGKCPKMAEKIIDLNVKHQNTRRAAARKNCLLFFFLEN